VPIRRSTALYGDAKQPAAFLSSFAPRGSEQTVPAFSPDGRLLDRLCFWRDKQLTESNCKDHKATFLDYPRGEWREPFRLIYPWK